MTICLNQASIKQYNTTLDEIIFLLTISNQLNLQNAEKTAISKGYITAVGSIAEAQPTGYRITETGTELLNSVLLASDKMIEPSDILTDLATRLKTVFPKGKKEGTNYYWTDGVALIIRRLQLFFKKYGNNFTHEQILNATKNYVKGFNGNYQYMKLLKYFIFKEKINAAGEIEGESELLSYIENEGQENYNNNWNSTIL